MSRYSTNLYPEFFRRILVISLKKLDLGSALAVRLTKLTGKSKVPIHPKHFLREKPWFVKYINKSDYVLDLGSGNGQSTLKAAKIAKKVLGIEIDLNQIRIAQETSKREGIKNIQFQIGNLEKKLDFKDNTFSKIIFLDVLEHLVNRDQILSEVKRVLEPKGLLFLGVPNSQTSWKKFQRSVNLCSYADPGHKIEFTEKSTKELLNKHNFGIIHFGYGPSDTPLRGLFDIIGVFSLGLYKKISNWRQEKVGFKPKEASGFEIAAINKK